MGCRTRAPPSLSEQSSAFPAMLRELDSNMGSLKLETYGISVTTMEEVRGCAGQGRCRVRELRVLGTCDVTRLRSRTVPLPLLRR